MNYLTEQDLNAVKGLLHYLNDQMASDPSLVPDITLIDSNGEKAGSITFNADEDGYVLTLSA